MSKEVIHSGYFVGPVQINPGLVLSPMSGVTNSAFRRLIKELNPGAVGLVVTEFISVEGLTRESRRSYEMMLHKPEERPFAVQLFGFDIKRMRDAALMAQDAGADFVDINCGCPAPKVVRKGGGCELMRQPEHLARMFKEVRSALRVPLTMKMRSGWDGTSLNCVEIAKIAENEGLAAVAIHGRTRVQLYRGLADWQIVQQVVESIKIPVLGSGDVFDRQSALERLATGVSGLFIGRASLKNPFVFNEILSGEKTQADRHAVRRVFQRYAELLLENCRMETALGKLKQLTTQFCKGHDFRKKLLLSNSVERFLGALDDIPEPASCESDGTLAAPS